ncbi:MATE family efflux transporter [Holdemania filiformis]|uniref:MATE family efflux transporter n=1 Tax=Holdemania filiformis TaxID=61171 RepID=UPI00242D97DC|nr:MATE family efflux transporter [Holdemania filiformis]
MKADTYLLAHEKIGAAMIKLAVPAVMVSVISLIYELINSFFIGRLNNTAMLASISLSATLTLLISKIGEAAGIGAASYLGRQLGAKQEDAAAEIVRTTITFTAVFSVVFTVAALLLLNPYLRWQTQDPAVLGYGQAYGLIMILFAVCTSLYTACIQLFRAVGDVKYPMVVMALSVFLNILLDPFLMFDFGLGLGVVGAAIASAAAQFAALMLCLRRLLSKQTALHWKLFDFHIDWPIIREIFSVGFAVYVRNLMSSAAILVFTKVVFTYGVDFAAGCNVGKFTMYFVNFFIQGVANGYLPLASFTYGAKDYQRLWDAIVWNLKVLTGYSLIAIGLVALFAPAFVSVFTTGQAAQSYGAQYLKAYNWSLPVYSVYYIFTITLQAAGKGRESMILSLFRQGIIYVPLLLLLSRTLGQPGVFYAQPGADWITVLTAVILSRSLIREIFMGKEKQKRASFVGESHA